MILLQSSTIFKQKNNREKFCDYNLCMKFFITPNSKIIFATLPIVKIEKSMLKLLIIFYFHENTNLVRNKTKISPLSETNFFVPS